jgi:hypothetical protein
MLVTKSKERWLLGSLIALVVSAAYLYGYPSATIFFGIVVLFHVATGIVFTLLLAFTLFPLLRGRTLLARFGWLLLAAGAVLGIVLIKIGTPNHLKSWLYAHIALCLFGVVSLFASWLASRGWLGSGVAQRGLGFVALLLVAAGIAAGAWWTREIAWKNANRISNPHMPPERHAR